MTPQELKDWRIGKGLTQDQVAFLFGITVQGYQKRENGKAPLSPETGLAMLALSDHPEIIAARLKDYVPSHKKFAHSPAKSETGKIGSKNPPPGLGTTGSA